MHRDWQERIVVDPKVLVGKPLIRGTRLSVEFILDLLANDWTIEQILSEYPQLEREDVMAVLKYAAEMAKEEKVYPLPYNSLLTKKFSNKVVGALRSKGIDIIPINELTSGVSDESVLEAAINKMEF